jgi:hypothetical protein
MATDDQSMTEAMDAWITARERFLADRKGGMDAYLAAYERLLAAFASDWTVDDAVMFGKAYSAFRARLSSDVNRQPANTRRDRKRTCDEA